MLCLPIDVFYNSIKPSDYRDFNIIRYLNEGQGRYILVLSLTSEELASIGNNVVVLGKERDNRTSNYDYRQSNLADSFEYKERALDIIRNGCDKITEIHNNLNDLSYREKSIVDRLYENDPVCGHLRAIREDRNSYDTQTRLTLRNVCKRLTYLSPEEQIKGLSTVFECMPTPNTNSINSLKFTTLRSIVFPRRYLFNLMNALYFSINNLNPDEKFSMIHVGESINEVIRRQTNYSMSNPDNHQLRIMTVPGSYGTGKR